MGSTLEMVIVGVVVGAALVWAGIAGWRSVRQQGTCSSCGSSGDCPIAKDPDALTELAKKGQLPHLDSCQPGTFSCQELAETLEKEADPQTTDQRS